MKFDLNQAISLLERTPSVLRNWLHDLPEGWTQQNEGPDTWSPFDIMGHYIHGEKTDWIPRAKIILSDSEEKTFEPFDRFAQENESKDKNINDLLKEFEVLRKNNLITLRNLNLQESDYEKTGTHPELGTVTLSQLLSTWVVHDQSHLAQIARVMAKQYIEEVGPWGAYIPLLHK
jgi:hypothetical protein